LIVCPWCGPRAQIEFTYAGDASLKRPDPVSSDDAEWVEYVYLRDNPKGPHDELWQHTSGCRKHIKVRRDTVSHDILATGPLADDFDGDNK